MEGYYDNDLAHIDARLFEYPWEDIHAFEQEPIQEAINAGYTQEEVDAYQGKTGLQDRLAQDVSYRALNDPQFASGLRAPSESIPLTPMDELPSYRIGGFAGLGDDYQPRTDPLAEYVEPPENPEDYEENARAAYANALLRGDVTSPRDFAERYAGALLAADPDTDQGSLVRATSGLGAALPSDEDFTDQAIAIARDAGVEVTPEGVRVIKERVVDHWSDTGDSLLEIYRQTRFDAEFRDNLTAAPPPQMNWLDKFGTGVRDALGGGAQLMVNALPQEFVRTIDQVNNDLADLGLPLAKIPIGGLDSLERGRLAMLAEEGYDASWWRWGGEVVATLPIFTTLGLTGMWGLVAAGASGGAAAAAFHPLTAQDYWTAKASEIGVGATLGAGLGAALYGAGKAIAAMSPKGAEMLRNVLRDMDEPKVKVLNPGDDLPAVEVRAGEAMAPVQVAERAVVEATDSAAPATTVPQFAPDAAPAAKIGALARDFLEGKADVLENMRLQREGLVPDEFGPNFFSRLAAGQDAPTVALAEGMDGARGVVEVLADIGGRLLRDDSGALTIFPNAAQKAARTAYRDSRDFSQDLIVAGRGTDERQLANYRYQFDFYKPASGKIVNLHKLVNKHMAEWREEITKGPMGNPMGTTIGDMVQYIEGRTAGYMMNANNPLAPVADTIRAINMHLRVKMEGAATRGLHSLNSYYDDYFRHLWDDPNAADRAFGVGRAGSGQSFNLRTLPTMADGLARGLKPAIENPIELTMFDAAQKLRYLKTLDMLDNARNATDSAGNPFAYWAHQAKPGTPDVPLAGVGSTKDTPVGQLRLYANPGFANAWNVWHGMGIHRGKSLYDQLLYAKNVTTAQQLLLPFFHTATMVVETVAGGMANALTELGTGTARMAAGKFMSFTDAAGVHHAGGIDEFGRGLLDLGMSATFFPKLVQQIVRGHRGIHGYDTMSAEPVIQILTESGARFGPRQDIYLMGRAPVIWDSIRRGSLAEEYRAQGRYLLGDPNDTTAQRIVGAPFRVVGFTAHEIGRLTNTISGPLFDLAIPRLKTGVNMERMQTYLRQNPLAAPEQVMARARQIARNTDDRMGEMNMDNVFWPKTIKQITQLLMISPGWVYGFARFGAATMGVNLERMQLEANKPAMQAMAGFAAAYAMESMTYQYLKTGTFPWNTDTPIRDVVAPRSGGIDAKSGLPERSLLPSQAKEYMDYFKIGASAWHSPAEGIQAVMHYLLGKAPGLWQIVRGMATGEDAIGHKIGATPGGWPGFVAKNLTPIFWSSFGERKIGTGISNFETFVGIRPMTKSIQDTEGFFKGLDNLHNMNLRNERSRIIRENRIYETPREVPDMPPSTRGGRGRSSSGGAGDPSRMKITRQKRYRSDEYLLDAPLFRPYTGRRSPRGRTDVRYSRNRSTTVLRGQ